MALIVDTGTLFSALNRRDRDHLRCAELFATDETVVVPAPVVVETEWLVTERLGPPAFDPIYEDITTGTLKVHDMTVKEWGRVRELCHQYSDLPLGLVDASVVALAETLEEEKIGTLDHRHFHVVRPRHTRSLRLIPE